MSVVSVREVFDPTKLADEIRSLNKSPNVEFRQVVQAGRGCYLIIYTTPTVVYR